MLNSFPWQENFILPGYIILLMQIPFSLKSTGLSGWNFQRKQWKPEERTNMHIPIRNSAGIKALFDNYKFHSPISALFFLSASIKFFAVATAMHVNLCHA